MGRRTGEYVGNRKDELHYDGYGDERGQEGLKQVCKPLRAGSVCLPPRTAAVSSGSSRTGREIALAMAAGSGARGVALCCVALVLLLVPAVSAFYLPGVAPQDFAQVSATLQTAM